MCCIVVLVDICLDSLRDDHRGNDLLNGLLVVILQAFDRCELFEQICVSEPKGRGFDVSGRGAILRLVGQLTGFFFKNLGSAGESLRECSTTLALRFPTSAAAWLRTAWFY
jgi:hypothetical protein